VIYFLCVLAGFSIGWFIRKPQTLKAGDGVFVVPKGVSNVHLTMIGSGGGSGGSGNSGNPKFSEPGAEAKYIVEKYLD
jgi:hypothetical protein